MSDSESMKETTRQVKVYALVNGLQNSVFNLRLSIIEEYGTPLVVDLDQFKQEVLTKLPKQHIYDEHSLAVFKDNELKTPIINSSQLLDVIKNAHEQSKFKLTTNILTKAKPVEEKEELKPVIVSAPSVPAPVPSNDRDVQTLQNIVQELTKERDQCLLYVKILQEENENLKKWKDVRQEPPSVSPSSLIDEHLERRLQPLMNSFDTVGQRFDRIEEHFKLQEGLLQTKFADMKAAQVDKLKDIHSSLEIVKEQFKSSFTEISSCTQQMRTLSESVARYQTEISSTRTLVEHMSQGLLKAQEEFEQRLEAKLIKKLESLVEREEEKGKLPSPSVHVEEIMARDSHLKTVQASLMESKSDLVVNTTTTKPVVSKEHRSTSHSPISLEQVTGCSEPEASEFEDEDPTDSGFRIVSVPQSTAVKSDSVSELQRSLTESQVLYGAQLRRLESLGHKIRSLNCLLLSRHGGDVDKVILELERLPHGV